jgi:hypothetical protein
MALLKASSAVSLGINLVNFVGRQEGHVKMETNSSKLSLFEILTPSAVAISSGSDTG